MGLDDAVVREKVEQARAAVARSDADCWLTFCRETGEIDEPALPYLLGYDVVWPAAVVVGPDSSVAVVGELDADAARTLGVHEVVGYDRSIEAPLNRALADLGAGTIALNYDPADPVADGLTHGMFRTLRGLLDGDYEFVSAGDVVRRVRGRKSAAERERVAAAGETTEELLAGMAAAFEPGWTEADVAGWLHDRLRERGLSTAWSADYCPSVHAGPESAPGHAPPGDRAVGEGECLHVDFGVRYEGYAADLQRTYVLGEPAPALREAFADVRAAIGAGIGALEPGARGHAVDAAARETLTARGWPEFEHGAGHQVGRAAHDGGTLLCPEWDRYGEAVYGTVRAGELYAVELGVATDYGYVGGEENVRVTGDGVEYLVSPQTELRSLD